MVRTIGRLWPCAVVLGLVLLPGKNLVRADMLYAVNASTQTLESIDTDTLVVRNIGALGITDNHGGLAYDLSNNTLYLHSGRGVGGLYTVNVPTGAATLVGFHGVGDLFGLGYDSTTNSLHGSQFDTGNKIYTSIAGTGAATLVGSTGLSTGVEGLAFNSNTSTLVGINDSSGNLYSINETTGNAQYIASPGSNDNSGLAYDTTKNLYWDIDYSGNLYSIDPANNDARTLRLSGLAPQGGLAFVSTTVVIVPAPSSVVMLGTGVVGLFAAWHGLRFRPGTKRRTN